VLIGQEINGAKSLTGAGFIHNWGGWLAREI